MRFSIIKLKNSQTGRARCKRFDILNTFQVHGRSFLWGCEWECVYVQNTPFQAFIVKTFVTAFVSSVAGFKRTSYEVARKPAQSSERDNSIFVLIRPCVCVCVCVCVASLWGVQMDCYEHTGKPYQQFTNKHNTHGFFWRCESSCLWSCDGNWNDFLEKRGVGIAWMRGYQSDLEQSWIAKMLLTRVHTFERFKSCTNACIEGCLLTRIRNTPTFSSVSRRRKTWSRHGRRHCLRPWIMSWCETTL